MNVYDHQPFPQKEMRFKFFSYLRQAAKKQCVAMFHASLTDDTKTTIYPEFSQSTSQTCCLVATVAFEMVSFSTLWASMSKPERVCFFYLSLNIACSLLALTPQFPSVFLQGVDIPSVRVVIAYGLPDTLAQLYQVC